MIEILTRNNTVIHLVGTAHVSKESVAEVEKVIEEVKPDTVCVELCGTRMNALRDENAWKEMNIIQVIKEGKAALLLANLVIGGYQKKIAQKLGVRPGEEMIQAMRIGKRQNAHIVPADREIGITLRRVWQKLRFSEKMKLIFRLTGSLFVAPDVKEADIEELLQKDTLTHLIEDMGKEFPTIKETLIDERDQYIAHNINQAAGSIVVAVVGAGHLNGIKRRLEENDAIHSDISRLSQIPPPGKGRFFFKWGLPILIIGIIVYGFVTADAGVSIEMLKRWVLINGVLAAAGALLAGGHPLTIVSAFLAAPFTSINPTIAAGWVAGLTEAWIRKPKVADFENLSHDTTSLKGFRANKITKILLVIILTNIGSSVGTFVGLPLISSLL